MCHHHCVSSHNGLEIFQRSPSCTYNKPFGFPKPAFRLSSTYESLPSTAFALVWDVGFHYLSVKHFLICFVCYQCEDTLSQAD